MSFMIPPNNLDQVVSWIRTYLVDQFATNISQDLQDLTQIKADISNLKTRATNLEQADIDIRARLTALETTLSAMETRLSNLETFKTAWARKNQAVVNNAVEILWNNNV